LDKEPGKGTSVAQFLILAFSGEFGQKEGRFNQRKETFGSHAQNQMMLGFAFRIDKATNVSAGGEAKRHNQAGRRLNPTDEM
jgi:hypothetical protein